MSGRNRSLGPARPVWIQQSNQFEDLTATFVHQCLVDPTNANPETNWQMNVNGLVNREFQAGPVDGETWELSTMTVVLADSGISFANGVFGAAATAVGFGMLLQLVGLPAGTQSLVPAPQSEIRSTHQLPAMGATTSSDTATATGDFLSCAYNVRQLTGGMPIKLQDSTQKIRATVRANWSSLDVLYIVVRGVRYPTPV